MHLERVDFNGKEIVLLGTAHISQKSVDEVREAIEKERPDVVGVELDAKRMEQLRHGENWQNTNIGSIISSGQTYLFLLTIMLSNLQRSLGVQVGVKPGMEMMEALKAAEEKQIPVALLDRDVTVTLKRAIRKMSMREKYMFISSAFSGFFSEGRKALTPEVVEELKDKDLLNKLLQQLGREMPSVKGVLVDERDQYIAHSIINTPGKKILCVVGAGHVAGIKEALGKRVDINSITNVEKGTDWLKAIQIGITVLFAAIILWIFLTKGSGVTLNAIAVWFLATGLCAAAGALLARAHPYTIIAAFIAAPLKLVHPFVSSGMISAYVEAKVRNPKVRDFEQLRNLNSLGDFASNQVTKILLIAALTNIGSIVGTLIAFPLVASLIK